MAPGKQPASQPESSQSQSSQSSHSQSSLSPSSSPSSGLRHVTVDRVLQFASDIPSSRPRHQSTRAPPLPPAATMAAGGSGVSSAVQQGSSLPATPQRRLSISGSGASGPSQSQGPGAHVRTAQPLPSRTTKISEKLVLLPETTSTSDEDDTDEGGVQSSLPLSALAPATAATATATPMAEAEAACRHLEGPAAVAAPTASVAAAVDDDSAPLRDEELDVLRKRGGIRGKSYAERLPKPRRAEEKVARVTAYCTAEAFKVKEVAEFARRRHEAKTKLYDDCLYTVYALPLLPGPDGGGIRLRSRPVLRTPGSGKTVLDLEIERNEQRHHHEGFDDDYAFGSSGGERRLLQDVIDASSPAQPMGGRLAPDPKSFAEMFVFSYGVVVFWNFTEREEKDLLADLTFAGGATIVVSHDKDHHNASETSPPPKSLMTRQLLQEDVETEQFHFEYSADVARPRVFNDMITLLPRSDHMVKLTISHAIAQSTKLCFFEERMAETMASAHGVPQNMALTGQLNMERREVLKMMGKLFKDRVEINLSSNILDVPDFFWDAEPTLHPLYVAIRDYLEIDPRIKVLNERCRVFLDLSEILSDSIADSKMSLITWIIIVLIVVSIVIESAEIVLRTALMRRGSGAKSLTAEIVGTGNATAIRTLGGDGGVDDYIGRLLGELPENVSLDDVRRWAALMAASGEFDELR